jgi:hypothetical protein
VQAGHRAWAQDEATAGTQRTSYHRVNSSQLLGRSSRSLTTCAAARLPLPLPLFCSESALEACTTHHCFHSWHTSMFNRCILLFEVVHYFSSCGGP